MSSESVKYSNIEFIGKGSFGSVYKAFDNELNQNVALKFLHNISSYSTEQLAREYYLMSKDYSPYVAEVYGFYQSSPKALAKVSGLGENTPFISMEYLDYSTLENISRLSNHQKVHIIIDLCMAVEHIHSYGIIHGDLKPENVFITDNGIKLVDFGLSSEKENSSKSVSGSLAWIAPEVLQGFGKNTTSDIYSLAAIIYYIIFKHNPFEKTDINATIQAHFKGISYVPENDILNEDSKKLLLKMLRIEPHTRLKSPYYLRYSLENKFELKSEAKDREFFIPEMSSLLDDLRKIIFSHFDSNEKQIFDISIEDIGRYRKFINELIPFSKKEGIQYFDLSNPHKIIREAKNIDSLDSEVVQKLNEFISIANTTEHFSDEQLIDLANIIERISYNNKVICNAIKCDSKNFLDKLLSNRKRCTLVIIREDSSGFPVKAFNSIELSNNIQSILAPCMNKESIVDYLSVNLITKYSQITQEISNLIANNIIEQTRDGWLFQESIAGTKKTIFDKLNSTSLEILAILSHFGRAVPSRLLLNLYGSEKYYYSYTELLKYNLVNELKTLDGIELELNINYTQSKLTSTLIERFIEIIPSCDLPVIWHALRLELCFQTDNYSIVKNESSDLLKLLKKHSAYEAAFIIYNILYKIYLSDSDFESQVKYLKLQALMMKYQGKFEDAVDALSSALDISENNDLTEYKCNILNDLGVIFFEKGMLFDSLNFYLDSEIIAENLKKNNLLLRIRSNIAGCYHKMHKYNLAEKYYSQTLKDLEKTPNKRIEAVIKYNFCELSITLGKQNILSLISEIQSLCEEVGLSRLFFQSKLLECELMLKNSKNSKALEILIELESENYTRDRFLETILNISKLRFFLYSSRIDRIKETLYILQELYWVSQQDLQIEIKKIYLLVKWFFPNETFDYEFDIHDQIIDDFDILLGDTFDFDSLIKCSRTLFNRGEFLAYAISIIKISQEFPPGFMVIKDALGKLYYEESIVSGILSFELAKLYIQSDEYELAVETLDSARVFFGKANNEYLMSKVDDCYSSISRKDTAIELTDTVAILDIINSINSNLNFDDTIMRILSEIIRISGADRGIFFRNSSEILQPVVVVNKNNQSGDIRGIRYSSTVLNEAIKSKKALFRERIVADDKLSSSDSIMNLEIKMVLCIPLLCNDILLGAIYTDAKLGSEAFSQEKRNIIEILSKTASIALNNSQTYQSLEFENIKLKENAFNLFSDKIIGNSEIMKKVFYKLRVVAPEKIPVLLTGETGTGKDLLAKEIHRNSPRSDKPFITINCAAVPENLLESELFGYEKGAFTGAVSQKKGKFEIANEGTIFLNEIGEMPMNLQAKLLTVIENMTFQRLGGTSDISVDIRLITATNRYLLEQIQNGLFREDLYYRIRSVQIEIPPLRERKSDIPLLINHFIQKRCEQTNRNITGITPEAMNILKNFEWKGNIRQLINIIDETVLFCNQKVIQVSDLPSMIQPKEHVSMSGVAVPNDYTELKNAKDVIEKEALEQALNNANWNISETAKNFGINRSRLHQLINKYNLHKD